MSKHFNARFGLILAAATIGITLTACGGGGGGDAGGGSSSQSSSSSTSSSTSSSSSSASVSSSSSSSSSSSNSSGSSSSSLPTIAPSALSYANPQIYTRGIAITALNPTITGTVTSYSVSPALPAGLSLNTANGQISGTPTTTAPVTTYTITASNNGGSTAFFLTLSVKLPPTTVAVSYGIKQVILNWNTVNGATHYRVFKSPTGSSGYTQLGSNVTNTTYTDTVAVHLTDWVNASYIVAACNSDSCTNSATISGFDARQAIGYLKPSNAGNFPQFGHDVALSADGTTLAVGGHTEMSSATGINGNQADSSAPFAGAVYVFIRSGNTWTQQAYIKASNTENGDLFGRAVTLSADGSTLAVSAYAEDSAATGIDGAQADNSMDFSGAVYVFTRSGSTWSQQAYVKASNTAVANQFGQSVALSADGNTLAVGAIGESGIGNGINGSELQSSMFGNTGAVYVFIRSGSTWSQQAYVKASNRDVNDEFGWAVALSGNGDTMVVGAFREDGGAVGINGNQADNSMVEAGAAYIFVRSSGTWSQQAYVKASNTDPNDGFGVAVAVSTDGNTVVVGAARERSSATGINGNQADNSSPNTVGAVYVLTRSGSTWSQQAYVKPSNTGGVFGSDVTLNASGDILAVGAYLECSAATGINGLQTDTSKCLSGAVYVFNRSNGTWSQQSYVKASNTDAYDQFGFSVSLSADGNTLAVGADQEASAATGVGGTQTDNSDPATGAVYLY